MAQGHDNSHGNSIHTGTDSQGNNSNEKKNNIDNNVEICII